MARRDFGTVETLPSGNFRAFWRSKGRKVTAPYTFPNKRAAQEWLSAQHTALAKGEITPHQQLTENTQPVRVITLGEWVEILLKRRAKDGKLSKKSIQTYQSNYDKHLEKPFGSRPLAAITADEVRSWYNSFDPADSKVRQASYRTLSAFLGAAIEERLIEESPMKVRGAMKKPRKGPDNPRSIVATPDQVKRLSQAMPEEMGIAVLLGFWCAMRFGEITELRRKDIEVAPDRKNATVHIRRSVEYAAGYGYVVGPPKSEAGVRDLPVPSIMLPDLLEHLDANVPPAADSLLVHSTTSVRKWLSNNSLNWYFDKAVAAVPDLDQRFTFHGLRHSGLTLLGQNGATLAELMLWAGHSDVSTVIIYQHATQERAAELAERMSRKALEKPAEDSGEKAHRRKTSHPVPV